MQLTIKNIQGVCFIDNTFVGIEHKGRILKFDPEAYDTPAWGMAGIVIDLIEFLGRQKNPESQSSFFIDLKKELIYIYNIRFIEPYEYLPRMWKCLDKIDKKVDTIYGEFL
uniref:Uncharacterized protein n=1 Tax=Rhipiliopsis peltata TaxID=2320810 RepID=A0A386B1D1_9CHLO|nr:hypothetical protein [Rhipiliopsis peltata]AYC65504.1 hypothetical protein [Rhipiliopsis peltata]